MVAEENRATFANGEARPAMLLNYLNQLPDRFVRFHQRNPIALTILKPVRPLLIRVHQSLQRSMNERDIRRRGRAEEMSSREQLERFFGTLHAVDPGLPMIRLGGDGDGGYVVPDDLDGLAACFSPGVSDVADFSSGSPSEACPPSWPTRPSRGRPRSTPSSTSSRRSSGPRTLPAGRRWRAG